MTASLHTPVLLKEVTDYLAPTVGKSYVDATLGYGGHTLALLAKGAEVVGIDQDKEILDLAIVRIKEAGYLGSFRPLHSSFSKGLASLGASSFDGILFDLGVSSYQLDTSVRGFSFRADAPLDMRMDRDNQKVTARDLIGALGRDELTELFSVLGEEPRAKKIADAVVTKRKQASIETTTELAHLVESVVPRTGHLHPATKVFQALRMAVNTEREELKAALPSALSLLCSGGVLAVISFHSLEDSIVKAFAKSEGVESLTSKPVTPSLAEIATNPRSRSAKLRVLRRVRV